MELLLRSLVEIIQKIFKTIVKEVSIKAYEIIGTPQQEEGSISQHRCWKGGGPKEFVI